ncbi:hypothetical protein BEH94_08565 [Candidatus Altiarchaeales archaeon WOR_SM1_SCG]|nr:hypothetical protein BEH94_08565 [Candidatus Altiarchaeales archaeon WOR_SM1_SCG]
MNYEIKFHQDFFKDMKRLTRAEKERVAKQIYKINENPLRYLHMSGSENCYRVRIGNLRMIYLIYEQIIYFLIVYRRGKVYDIFHKRIHDIKKELENRQG